MSNEVRTRFAPSPTGNLHLGGARTALYCWAHARSQGGKLLLRIEDTDQERSKPEYERSIIEGLRWLGIDYDEELIKQSTRLEIYQAAAQKLLAQGDAYKCFATKQELDQLRSEQIANKQKPMYDRRWRDRSDYPSEQKFVLRFATSLTGLVTIQDVIRGEITFNNLELDDPVILREDGTPTYNFACAVDDLDSKISDVVRGEDHISNTVRQSHIIRALGGNLPNYAHLPLIMSVKLDEHGKALVDEVGTIVYGKMSKRDSATDVDDYRKLGFLPAAMVNYLAQLGWTCPDKEVYSPQELTEKFQLSNVHKSAAKFDLARLNWINQQHMRAMDVDKLASLAEITAPAAAVKLATEKAHTLFELKEEVLFFSEYQPNEDLMSKYLEEDCKPHFAELVTALIKLEQFETTNIKGLIKQFCKERGLRFPQLGMPLRLALTGREHSADIAQIAELLGQAEVIKRLARYID